MLMNAYELESPERKLVMWYKCKEKFEQGLSKAQIARELGLDVKTVRRYLKMSYDEFKSSESYKRMYIKVLDPYESKVYDWLNEHNDLSASQIHDWLRDRYDDLPQVNSKTVYNFVKYVRAKYNIGKPHATAQRQYMKIEETPFGEFAQADFGEMWMEPSDGRDLKVYFFVMVLCRSRKKFVYFSKSPFTAEMAVYAHEKAFEYYGGKPRKIIYDQDAVLIHDENLGDCILTKTFNAFVNQEHIECIFCHKSDPESKGKVENAVKYVKYNFLRGRTFVSIEQLNEEGVRWLSRTANGLPHNGTHLVPDDVFVEEKPYLIPYYGRPMMPERPMREYTVHKSNHINYRGNDYGLPSGTYKGPRTTVWVNVVDDKLEIYSKETGKLIHIHDVSSERGQYIPVPGHRRTMSVACEAHEKTVMEYCNYDQMAMLWMSNLKKDKPRYYTQNLNVLIKGMVHFAPGTLHSAFEKCIDRGMYNAKDYLSLCDRIGKRLPAREISPTLHDNLPAAVKETPERTDINQYNQYFS